MKYSDPTTKKLIRSGRLYKLSGSEIDFSKELISTIGPSRHFTFIFNTFVMMQFFNFLNARKLLDEWN
jgi:Ca2+ transporting ATPase